MDPLAFISSIASSIAWPVVALILAVAFRKQIIGLLDRPPTRVKAGPFEVEWAEAEKAVAVALATGAAAPARESIAGSLLDRLSALVDTDPTGAIMAAWNEVERALRDRVGGIAQQPSIAGATLAHIAREGGHISAQTEEALGGLRALRNLAAHGPGGEVDRGKARDYVALADSTIYAIRTWRPKDGSTE